MYCALVAGHKKTIAVTNPTQISFWIVPQTYPKDISKFNVKEITVLSQFLHLELWARVLR
jgi:hypothetical protein